MAQISMEDACVFTVDALELFLAEKAERGQGRHRTLPKPLNVESMNYGRTWIFPPDSTDPVGLG